MPRTPAALAPGTPAALVAGLVVALAAGLAGCGEGRLDVLEVRAAYDSLAARVEWPGFRPSEVPLAVFDGSRTWLFRHPDPPSDFRRGTEREEVRFLEGRHPAVTANTAIELGGVETAAALADTGARRPVDLALTLIHEAFHVHQRRRHPEWAPNEVELFTYPVNDPEALRLRRLETTALRRALRSESPDSVRRLCWSRAWLRIRADRMGRLPVGAAGYERAAETWEGLARYVEASAAGPRARPPELPGEGYPPEAVRSRAYDVGHALAWLLDRVDPGWKERLDAGETASPEEALARAPAVRRGKDVCRLTPDETRRALAVARADIRRLAERREERRRRFEEAAGWRVEIVAPRGAPLFPRAFDPQNVEPLGEGIVLHGRWLRLEGEGGSVELLGTAALTEAAGPHPLFTGVRRLLVTGLREEPEAERVEGTLRLRARGLAAELPGATLVRSGRSWRVELAVPGAGRGGPGGGERGGDGG